MKKKVFCIGRTSENDHFLQNGLVDCRYTGVVGVDMSFCCRVSTVLEFRWRGIDGTIECITAGSINIRIGDRSLRLPLNVNANSIIYSALKENKNIYSSGISYAHTQRLLYNGLLEKRVLRLGCIDQLLCLGGLFNCINTANHL